MKETRQDIQDIIFYNIKIFLIAFQQDNFIILRFPRHSKSDIFATTESRICFNKSTEECHIYFNNCKMSISYLLDPPVTQIKYLNVDTENEYKRNAFLLQIRNIFKTDILRLIFSIVCSVITDLNLTVEQEKQR